jgi:hypothetical protein
MTCKDCVHYDKCYLIEHYGADEAETCEDFKNKSNYEEVVHCKDCQAWKRNIGFIDSPNGHCFYHDMCTNGFDYCSWGERRTPQ